MTGTYHIWPLTAGLLYAYLISLAGIRMGLYTRAAQRRFWNVFLLIVFLGTASLGLFFAFQVNYKIDFKAEDTWMLLHVDFGISMAVITVFHFTWHISYYLGIFRSGNKKTVQIPPDNEPDKQLSDVNTVTLPGFHDRIPVYLLGFTTMITQVVLLRAFMNVFDGNELVIGINLGNWMLLTGLGAWLGRKVPQLRDKPQFISRNLIWLGLLPLVTIALLYTLKNIIFVPGSLTGLFPVFLYSLLLLIPFCILSGYSFTLYSFILSGKAGSNLTGRTYAWEAAGSLSGGLLFSFILVFVLKSVQILSLVFIANLTGAFLWQRNNERTGIGKVLLTSGILTGIVILFLPADRYLQHFLYPNQTITDFRDTPVGNFVLTRMGDQYSLFENGVLIANTLDKVANEEDVHYAMLQRPGPDDVLLISGGVTGMIREILKYPVKTVDYLELNPWIIKAGKAITGDIDLPEVHVINKDPGRYVQTSEKKYDVILMHIPPPSTAQLNRFFTVGFYRSLKKILKPGGVVCFSLPYSPNYVGNEGLEVISLTYFTLKEVFRDIEIIPGEKNYFLASDRPLSLRITELLEKRGIQNDYVSPYYISDDLLLARNRQISGQLVPVTKLNTDLDPAAYFREISLWLSYYRFDTRFFIGALALLFLFLILRSGRIQLGMFAGGFAASSVEIMLLFVFQILFGNIYLMISLFISLFMAGLVFGALSAKPAGKRETFKKFTGFLFLIGLLAIIPPVYLVLSSHLLRANVIIGAFLLGHIFLFAFLTGRLFSFGSSLLKGTVAEIASGIYSADLAGGALGALAVSGFLLPLAGLSGTGLLTGGLCMVVLLVVIAGKSHFTE